MNRKIIYFLAAFIPSVGLILMGGCSKTFGPVIPTYIPNTSTPTGSPTPTGPVGTPAVTGSPTPLYTTGTAVPSITHTPTNSPTNSPTNTPTNTITVTPVTTACQTAVPWGESAGTGAVTINGTLCQKYTSALPLQVNAIDVDLASPNSSVVVGIYSDSSNYPGSLIWSSPSISMTAGGYMVWLQSPMFSGNPAGITLPAGSYWLAVSSPSTLYLVAAASSTTNKVTGSGNMPDPFPAGNSLSTTGQAGLGAEINTCSARPTQIPTYTPASSAASATSTPTLTGSPTPIFTIAYTSGTAVPSITNTPTNSPTNTATLLPITTPTWQPTPPASGIFWQQAEIGVINGNSGAFTNFYMAVNGMPESTAGVTLTCPGGVIVPFTYYSNYGQFAAYGPGSTTIPYQAGGVYTLTTNTSAGVASASLVAPGGNITMASDGSSVSWNVEGNEDFLWVYGASYTRTYDSQNTTIDIDSPAAIPASAYPVPGNYGIQGHVQNTTYTIAGAVAGSSFMIDDWYQFTITK